MDLRESAEVHENVAGGMSSGGITGIACDAASFSPTGQLEQVDVDLMLMRLRS